MTLGIRPTVKSYKFDHMIFNPSPPTLQPIVKHSVMRCNVVPDPVFNGITTVSKLVCKIFKNEFHVQYYKRQNNFLLGLKALGQSQSFDH